MKIKLVLLDDDTVWLQKIASALSTMEEALFETYTFSDEAAAVRMICEAGYCVLLAGQSAAVNPAVLPSGCCLIRFTDVADASGGTGMRSIFRFQKAEAICREIRIAYAEFTGNALPEQAGDSSRKAVRAKVHVFCPCGGGTGSSSAAAACALRFAGAGSSALYLNLERFGSSELYFQGEGKSYLGDLLYAIKSKKPGLEMKLRSAVKQDDSGVWFIDSCRYAPEVMEISGDDIPDLLTELGGLGLFAHIVIDTDLLLEGASLALMRAADDVVLVSDGSETSLIKLRRIRKAMEILAAAEEKPFPETFLLYNRYSSKTGRAVDDPELPQLGGAPRFEGASPARVIRKLAEYPMFDRLL